MSRDQTTIYDFFKAAVMGEDDSELKNKQFTKDIKAHYKHIQKQKDFKGFGEFVKLMIHAEKVALDFKDRATQNKLIDIEFVDRQNLAKSTIEHNQNLIMITGEEQDDE